MSPSKYDAVFDVDRRKGQDIELDQDFRPTTLLEQAQMEGYDRTSRPVGSVAPDLDKDGGFVDTPGLRGLSDTEAATRLGVNDTHR